MLAEVFETEDFICSDGTGGADFVRCPPWSLCRHSTAASRVCLCARAACPALPQVLPGALDFQHLHSDGGAGQEAKYRDVKLGTRPDGSTFWVELSKEEDPRCTYAYGHKGMFCRRYSV